MTLEELKMIRKEISKAVRLIEEHKYNEAKKILYNIVYLMEIMSRAKKGDIKAMLEIATYWIDKAWLKLISAS